MLEWKGVIGCGWKALSGNYSIARVEGSQRIIIIHDVMYCYYYVKQYKFASSLHPNRWVMMTKAGRKDE